MQLFNTGIIYNIPIMFDLISIVVVCFLEGVEEGGWCDAYLDSAWALLRPRLAQGKARSDNSH